MQKETYTLYQLNEYIRRIIALNFSAPVWVTAEINQVSASRGHFYLTLIEKDDLEGIIAQSDAVLWAGRANALRPKLGTHPSTLLQEGMEVKLRVRPAFHERYGYKLTIEDIDLSFTLGSLEQKRQAILEQLRAEGLLGKNRKCPLPFIIKRIAVISAKTAAGFEDFMKQIEHNPYGYQYHIRLFESAMQGTEVEREMLAALKSIRNLKARFDLVVIIRGGGAKIDLAAFDNYNIAEMTANFPIPVLTGIGHEMDQSLLDLVVHTALKTPTAVAQFLIEYHLRRESDIIEIGTQIQHTSKYLLNQKNAELKHLQDTIGLYAGTLLKRKRENIDQMAENLPYFAKKMLLSARKDLNNTIALHRLLDKDSILKRGFSLTLKDGNIIKDTGELSSGDQIVTLLANGEIESKVIKKTSQKK